MALTTVTSGLIAADAVTATQIAPSAVVTAKISDNAVTLAKLATQAANTVLVNATSAAAVPTAVALAASTVLGRDSTGNVSALTLSGLTAVGGVLTAAGGWEKVSSAEASASATIDFTSFAASYDYMIGFSNVVCSADVDLWFRFGTGAGPTYQTTNYQYDYMADLSGAEGGANASAQGQIIILKNDGTGTCASGFITVFNPGRSAATSITFVTGGFDSGVSSAAMSGFGMRTNVEVVTAGRVLPASGTITSGLFTLYRRANQ